MGSEISLFVWFLGGGELGTKFELLDNIYPDEAIVSLNLTP